MQLENWGKIKCVTINEKGLIRNREGKSRYIPSKNFYSNQINEKQRKREGERDLFIMRNFSNLMYYYNYF